MNIIWLTSETPYPPNTGGRMVMYKHIEYMAKLHSIYLFCIADTDTDLQVGKNMEKICKEVHLYKRCRNNFQIVYNLLRGPYICSSRWKRQMRKDILQCIEKNDIAVVIVEFPQMLGNLSASVRRRIPIVLNQHNTEYLALRNISRIHGNFFKRWMGWIDSYRMEILENLYYKKKFINLYTFVSTEDKQTFERKYPYYRTFLLPIGTETEFLSTEKHDGFNIMYIGKMEYLPNTEAAEWFAEKVFALLPVGQDYNYYIVGKNPLKSTRSLEKRFEGVHVTGTVNSMKEYYQKADLIVVPLFHGGGVKVKLIEALGYGKIVLTTSKGVEGTDFKKGEDLLVAESREDFIRLCKDIRKCPEKYALIKKTGFDKVVSEYSWQIIMEHFNQEIDLLNAKYRNQA